MGKTRVVRQPIVAELPGLDRLDRDLFKIRLRTMQRAAPGERRVVRVKGVGEIVLYRDEGNVRARVDGKPMAMAEVNRLVLTPGGKPKVGKLQKAR